jgi:hypothetical protein
MHGQQAHRVVEPGGRAGLHAAGLQRPHQRVGRGVAAAGQLQAGLRQRAQVGQHRAALVGRRRGGKARQHVRLGVDRGSASCGGRLRTSTASAAKLRAEPGQRAVGGPVQLQPVEPAEPRAPAPRRRRASHQRRIVEPEQRRLQRPRQRKIVRGDTSASSSATMSCTSQQSPRSGLLGICSAGCAARAARLLHRLQAHAPARQHHHVAGLPARLQALHDPAPPPGGPPACAGCPRPARAGWSGCRASQRALRPDPGSGSSGPASHARCGRQHRARPGATRWCGRGSR